MSADTSLRFEPIVHTDDALWRQRVMDSWDATEPRSARLTLLSAPAGFGKTTVLAQLARRAAQGGRQVAWLNCDERDKDPALFSGDLGLALARCESVTASEISGRDLLADRLARLQQPLLVCIDDYERASVPEVDALMVMLARLLPEHVNLVLASREPAPHALARLQLTGQVRLVDAEVLRFTAHESQQLLGDAWDEAARQKMVAYADGWAFALQLARLRASNAHDNRAAQDAHTADRGLDPFKPQTIDAQAPIPRRQIFDYLAHEVLAALPLPLRDFLRDVAILDRVDADVANVLRGCDDSAGLIRQLVAMRPVVVVDEQHWRVRLHPLLRDYLVHALEMDDPARLAQLHGRAARYLAQPQPGQTGRLHEAVGHAVAGGRLDWAADIIEQAGAFRLFSDQGQVRVRAMLQQLPDATLRRRPRLRLLQLMGQALEGDSANIQAAFERLEQHVMGGDADANDPARLDLAFVRCVLMLDASSRQLCFSPWAVLADCLALARAQSVEDERMLALTLSVELWFLHRYGPIGQCERRIRELEALHGRGVYTHNSPWLPLYHARSALAAGALDEAERCIRQSLHRDVNFLNWRQGSLHQLVLTLLGHIAYQRGDLEVAREHWAALQAPHMRYLEVLHGGHVALALCEFALGHADVAIAQLQAARQLAFEEDMPQLEVLASAAEMDVLARLGQQAEAETLAAREPWQHWWDLAQTPQALPWMVVYALARAVFGLHALRGDWSGAQGVAQTLARLAQDNGQDLSGLTAWLMQAQCADALAQPGPAHQHLQQALVLGQSWGAVQVFIDGGAPVMTLLRTWLAAPTTAPEAVVSWAQQLQQLWEQRFHSQAQSAGLKLLTPRELDVLCELAKGHTTKWMAKNLLLSPETVKHHLKSIFAKLKVKSREEAVLEARRRALMP